MNKIFETLKALGLTSESTAEVYADRTRDCESLKVYRDRQSGVIYIRDYYVGDSEYVSGQYRGSEDRLQEERDLQRRIQYLPTGHSMKIVDFGCGRGKFLKAIAKGNHEVSGIELQESYRELLKQEGISCVSSVQEAVTESDCAFLFHSLEHLPDPIQILKDIRGLLKPNGQGQIVVEVPHARAFLLEKMDLAAFRSFTLWSQHLVLHARESLRKILEAAGFRKVTVLGVQRYGMANHLEWIRNGRPGGHDGSLSIFDDVEMFRAYESKLNELDATDTLVAMATT